LRSNEIIIPPNGLLDVELDLSFSMQVNFHFCSNLMENTLISFSLVIHTILALKWWCEDVMCIMQLRYCCAIM